MSESAVSDKLLLLYGLARNRRSPKRPSEPRPSGAHPEEGEVGKDGAAYPSRMRDSCEVLEVSIQEALTGIRNRASLWLNVNRSSLLAPSIKHTQAWEASSATTGTAEQ